MTRATFRATLLFITVSLTGCADIDTARTPALSELQVNGEQLLVALADAPDTSLANVYTLEKSPIGWKRRSGPFPAMIGRNGFAPLGEKREGDGKVPTGLYPLESAFGYAASIDSRMAYRQATEDDLWVDDVNAPDYNTWVTRGHTTATSFEAMKLSDQRYQLGIITGYNRNPVTPGLGSAIFVHTWLEEGFTTSGCVALDGDDLAKILKWLDPAKRPMILMGTRADLARVPLAASLPPSGERPGVLEEQIRARVAGLKERLVEYRVPDGFFGMALALPTGMAARCTKDQHQGSAPSNSALVVLTQWGASGSPEIGELVIAKDLALQTIKEFARLYAIRLPPKNSLHRSPCLD